MLVFFVDVSIMKWEWMCRESSLWGFIRIEMCTGLTSNFKVQVDLSLI